jgi:two-component system CheB/CheR fusion protein
MPNAALATGLTDQVLPAPEIAAALRGYFAQQDQVGLRDEEDELSGQLGQIVDILREEVGHDFSGYKQPTMLRRVSRHMQLTGKHDVEEYRAFLRASPEAAEALFRDLLINVTHFFRDEEYYELLRREVVEPLVQRTPASRPLRVWVPGCSSGQEAYSLAMLFDQAASAQESPPLVQIFATDVSGDMVRIAREGHYPAAALKDIPGALRQRYTIGMDGRFRIAPKLRGMVRFSVHNLVEDPPFSSLDLVSCRNLLIYLKTRIQQQLIPVFHYSLRPGGYLFLGPSEGIGAREDLFVPVDQKARLFQRKDAAVREPLGLSLSTRRAQAAASSGPRGQDEGAGASYRETPNAELLERFAPPFVRLDEEGEICGSFGDLSPYLKTQPGERDQHISRLAREGLREVVLPLLARLRETGARQVAKDIEVRSRFGIQAADIVAEPLAEGMAALVFLSIGQFRQELQDYYVENAETDDRVGGLEAELRLTRNRLRVTVEELETANEELKSSNEEMMSMNEELQSVNEELKNKVDELGVVNADLANFLQSTRMAVVVVDRDLLVRTFTDQSRRVFPLQDSDKGRPLSEINLLVNEADFLSDITRCIEENDPVERIVTTTDGVQTFLMRILPYRSASGEIDGATLTFGDITRLKRLEGDLYEKSERLSLAMSVGEIGVWEIEDGTDLVMGDATLLRLFGLPSEGPIEVADFMERIHPEDRSRVMLDFTNARRDRGGYDQEFRIPLADGSVRWLKGVGRLLDRPNGKPRMLGLNYDITFEIEAKENQQLLVREMNHRVKNLFAVVASLINTTAKRATDVGEYAVALRERVNALGRAYELTQNRAFLAEVRLEALLSKILAPHTSSGTLTMEGPPLDVPVDAITPISLIVHELATNAVKYGGLSGPDTSLTISWQSQEGDLVALGWDEHGPAPAKAPPEDHGGFGTRLIDASIRQLRGSIERRWLEEGLKVSMTIRLPGNHR